jgi:hypothetical protein
MERYIIQGIESIIQNENGRRREEEREFKYNIRETLFI